MRLVRGISKRPRLSAGYSLGIVHLRFEVNCQLTVGLGLRASMPWTCGRAGRVLGHTPCEDLSSGHFPPLTLQSEDSSVVHDS